jgi:transcriptional regulator with XRE-family HTH domain
VFSGQADDIAKALKQAGKLGAPKNSLKEVLTTMDTGIRRAIARNVKTLRTLAGMTQGQLARKAGVAQTVISYIERPDGKSPAVDTLDQIAQALKVPAWALMMDLEDVSPVILARAGIVIQGYLDVTEDGRRQIERVVDAESRYASMTLMLPPPQH